MSYLDRREAVIQALANSYMEAMKSLSSSSSVQGEDVVSLIDIDCGGKACDKCMSTFISPSILNAKVQTKENLDLIHNISNTACAGNCVCDAYNVNVDSNVFFEPSAKINTGSFNVKDIAKNINQKLQEKFGKTSTSNEYDTKLVSLITQINEKTVQTINQHLTSMSSVVIKGGGVTVKNIKLKTVVNAVMSAIASICTPTSNAPAGTSCGEANQLKPNLGVGSNCSCAITTLDDIVQEQMQLIKEEVEKDVTTIIKYIWQESKTFLIVVGVVLLGLFVLIAALLIYRARYG